MVEKNYKEDGCGCRSAFIEKAILFCCGYLTAEEVGMFQHVKFMVWKAFSFPICFDRAAHS